MNYPTFLFWIFLLTAVLFLNIMYLYGDTMKRKMKSKADKFIHYFGEGTVWDLDYGKLLILFICIYIAIQVS